MDILKVRFWRSQDKWFVFSMLMVPLAPFIRDGGENISSNIVMYILCGACALLYFLLRYFSSVLIVENDKVCIKPRIVSSNNVFTISEIRSIEKSTLNNEVIGVIIEIDDGTFHSINLNAYTEKVYQIISRKLLSFNESMNAE